MIFITDKSIRQNAKKFGFKQCDTDVINVVNNMLIKFTTNKLQKVIQKYKKLSVIEPKHIQKGGRIVLPSEYFGVDSGSYTEKLVNNGTDMSITETFIRPTIATTDLSGAIKGGAVKFSVSKNAFKNALSEAKTKLQKDIKIKSNTSDLLQREFEDLMSDIMIKSSNKGKQQIISATQLESIAKQKKYKSLH